MSLQHIFAIADDANTFARHANSRARRAIRDYEKWSLGNAGTGRDFLSAQGCV